MIDRFIYNNVEYCIKKPENKPYYKISRVDNVFIKNQSKVCRDILISEGYDAEEINNTTGNNKLAKMVLKHLNKDNPDALKKKSSKKNKKTNEEASRESLLKSSGIPEYGYITNTESSLTVRELFNLLCAELTKYKEKYEISDVSKYFRLTDEINWVIVGENGLGVQISPNGKSLSFLLAEFVYHRNNRGDLGNPLINLIKNIDLYKDVFCNFDVNRFVSSDRNELKESFSRIIKPNKSKEKNLNTELKRFYNFAKYLNDLGSYNNVINDLRSHSDRNNPIKLVKYLVKDICGLSYNDSIALHCDFLKELDEDFNYLVKPDMHVKHFLCIYKGLGYPHKVKNEEILTKYIELVAELNEEFKDEIQEGRMDEITPYQLDRLIYLVGSGNLYLDIDTVQKLENSLHKWNYIMPLINSNRN